VETSNDNRSYSYHRCGAGPINVCHRAGAIGARRCHGTTPAV